VILHKYIKGLTPSVFIFTFPLMSNFPIIDFLEFQGDMFPEQEFYSSKYISDNEYSNPCTRADKTLTYNISNKF
jgi:hypothetical protein